LEDRKWAIEKVKTNNDLHTIGVKPVIQPIRAKNIYFDILYLKLNGIDMIIIITKYGTRYDYNLTIMETPKPAIDNRFKKYIKSYL
jgi:hypothetical protein